MLALKQFPPERVAEQLHKVLTAEAIPFDAPALRLIGEAAQGSMRDALSIADQAIAFGNGRVEEQQAVHRSKAAQKREPARDD